MRPGTNKQAATFGRGWPKVIEEWMAADFPAFAVSELIEAGPAAQDCFCRTEHLPKPSSAMSRIRGSGTPRPDSFMAPGAAKRFRPEILFDRSRLAGHSAIARTQQLFEIKSRIFSSRVFRR